MLDMKLKISTTFYSQIDGQIGVVNKSLGNLLSTHVGKHIESWDPKLSIAEFAYNSSINRTTCKSPHEIVYGFKLRQLIDLIPMIYHYRVS